MLRTRLSEALKDAMRARNQRTVDTMRMVLAGLKDRDIAARPNGVTAIDDAAIMSMMESMIKQRQESIALYEKGNRPELAQKEREEIAIIEAFLPQRMSDDEARDAIAAVIAELEATTIKDTGRVLTELRNRYAGRMDFVSIGGLVRQALTGR
jgi:uncharacterized protein YqeY